VTSAFGGRLANFFNVVFQGIRLHLRYVSTICQIDNRLRVIRNALKSSRLCEDFAITLCLFQRSASHRAYLAQINLGFGYRWLW